MFAFLTLIFPVLFVTSLFEAGHCQPQRGTWSLGLTYIQNQNLFPRSSKSFLQKTSESFLQNLSHAHTVMFLPSALINWVVTTLAF